MKDKEISRLIEQEKKRQKSVINLIASENYVSQDVLKALGSELTNKYGEGYPGRRYYRGVAVVDKVELLAQKRALKLFGLKESDWSVNVQPLSGSPANFAVYAALVPIGGRIDPSPFPYADIVTTTTHKTLRGPRSALIFSKRDGRELFKKIDKTILPGLQGGPHFNQIAAVAVALKEANSPAFKKYAKQIVKNTKILSDELSRLGWRIIEGGTETHLLRVDVWRDGKGIGGREAADKLEAAGIIVNENTIPFDTRSPMDPSGLRLGTAAETTRGRNEKDMIKIARRIDAILKR